MSNNENKYMKHIYDLTYFYIKKKYKKILKKKQVDFIIREELFDTIKELLVTKDEKQKYRDYIMDNLKQDFENVDEKEVNEIFDDMEEDTDMICNKIKEMIDEYQVKQGYYQ